MFAVVAAVCVFAAGGQLPSHRCSPGAVRSRATAAQVCKPGYSSRTRNVTSTTRRRIYAEYRQTGVHPFPEWEVDHLVPLELAFWS